MCYFCYSTQKEDSPWSLLVTMITWWLNTGDEGGQEILGRSHPIFGLNGWRSKCEFCMQNNQLSTKTPVELKDYSNDLNFTRYLGVKCEVIWNLMYHSRVYANVQLCSQMSMLLAIKEWRNTCLKFNNQMEDDQRRKITWNTNDGLGCDKLFIDLVNYLVHLCGWKN